MRTTRQRLGLGLAALGRPAYITAGRERDLGAARSVEAMRERTATVLDAAYAAGVRYLDCARSYGRAEEFLADWLHARPEVTDVVVASKWGYRYVGDWRTDAEVHEVKDHSLEAFTGQWSRTRAALGERVTVYQVHSLTPESPALHDGELHRALAGLRDEGVRIGVSTSGPAQGEAVRRALDLVVDGEPLVGVVQSTWNVLEQSAGPALADAAAAGVEVVVKECLANGRLAPGSDDAAPAARTVARLAQRLGVGPDQVALAAVLHQPWAARALSGAVTPEQVAGNVGATGLVLSDEDLASLTSRPEEPTAYWEARSRRAWR